MEQQIPFALRQAVQAQLPAAVQLSHELADYPELSGQEFVSSKKLVTWLRANGFVVKYPFAGFDTAFCAVLDCGEGPSVCFMAEYDALPEIGHGCGHNLHGVMSALAGIVLGALQGSFCGKVYVIGTPAEEEAGAKVTMAEQGIFDEMALATMMHSWSGGVGQPNMELLGLRCYVIDFFGEEAHAVAGPWRGKSALAAARKFMDLIDARRECFTPDIKVNSVFTDGGKAPNIIPGHAQLRIEFRTDSVAKLALVDEMIRKCANGAAMALDCSVTFEKGMDDFADMVCVPALEQRVLRLMQEAGEPMERKSMPNGSSDVGNVSYRCPTIQPLISICKEFHALHTEEIAAATRKPEAEAAMQHGAEVLAALALEILTDERYRKEVLCSFVEARKAKQTL